MENLYPFSFENCPIGIITEDREHFFQEIVQKFQNLSRAKLIDWIQKDFHLLHLSLMLHPTTLASALKTPYYGFKQTLRGDLTDDMFFVWTDLDLFKKTFLIELGNIFRMMSDNLYDQYVKLYKGEIFKTLYLKKKLPIYIDFAQDWTQQEYTMVKNYTYVETEKRNKWNRNVVVVPEKKDIENYNLNKINNHLFFPYHYYIMVPWLETLSIPDDIIRIIILYCYKKEIKSYKIKYYNDHSKIDWIFKNT